ncbi:STAS domain-containing protein [Edaphobacillus lindanitolerans]|uniref:RsbT co-antagonist protein RsbR n=1 Tax=Edaphobacillus lindanitolerans TaxID=550447 RepID=A0A1U7PSI7_9BACI|nr:STAS domain-containing protein [Edaphobacillus lindanitolerans]SIT91124.1 rsbT co-antagonist protein RsbR [Edaphobacillus lindanitolerans]
MQDLDLPLPLPYLRVDREGKITGSSALAQERFDLSKGHINSIIDEESIKKLSQFRWVSGLDSVKFELNMKTKDRALALFDVHLQWDLDDHANMILLPKDSANEKLTQKLMAIQHRLAETDFELLEKKEELEQVLRRLDELSGPFIPLSGELCMIPLFGDITADKINTISESCLQSVFKGNYEIILFDLTAVGEVRTDGVEKFIQLVKTLSFMTGNVIKLIGIKPDLAKVLNHYHLEQWVEFNHSLEQELRVYLNH